MAKKSLKPQKQYQKVINIETVDSDSQEEEKLDLYTDTPYIEKVGPIQRYLFNWAEPIINKKSVCEKLTTDDMGGLEVKLRIETKLPRLQESFKRNKSLIKSLLSAFRKEFIISYVLNMTSTLIGYLGPLVFGMLLSFLEEGNKNTFYGCQLVFLMIGCGLLSYALNENTGYHQFIIG